MIGISKEGYDVRFFFFSGSLVRFQGHSVEIVLAATTVFYLQRRHLPNFVYDNVNSIVLLVDLSCLYSLDLRTICEVKRAK